MKTEAQIRKQYEQIQGSLDERSRREWAASEAMSLGWGGIATVHRATGIVRSTIGRGIKELKTRDEGTYHKAPDRQQQTAVRRQSYSAGLSGSCAPCQTPTIQTTSPWIR